jgi:hypothetical protein
MPATSAGMTEAKEKWGAADAPAKSKRPAVTGGPFFLDCIFAYDVAMMWNWLASSWLVRLTRSSVAINVVPPAEFASAS